MNKTIPVITIDGPSGVGKGTMSKLLAEKLGWHYLDSGAIYRVLALAAKHHNIPSGQEEALKQLATRLDVSFDPSTAKVLYEGNDVTDLIRADEIGQLASKISALPDVRAALLQRQRDFRKAPGLVTDGRDMGGVVFPDAVLKIFLTASAESRADRRYDQLQKMGLSVSRESILHEMRERDERDLSRAAAPLKKEADAIELESSHLSISQAFQRIMDWVNENPSLRRA